MISDILKFDQRTSIDKHLLYLTELISWYLYFSKTFERIEIFQIVEKRQHGR